jgi:hypothetical protein
MDPETVVHVIDATGDPGGIVINVADVLIRWLGASWPAGCECLQITDSFVTTIFRFLT